MVANLQFSSKCQLNLDVYELLNYLVSILFLADMRLSNDTDLSVYIPYLNKDKDRNKTFLFSLTCIDIVSSKLQICFQIQMSGI